MMLNYYIRRIFNFIFNLAAEVTRSRNILYFIEINSLKNEKKINLIFIVFEKFEGSLFPKTLTSRFSIFIDVTIFEHFSSFREISRAEPSLV